MLHPTKNVHPFLKESRLWPYVEIYRGFDLVRRLHRSVDLLAREGKDVSTLQSGLVGRHRILYWLVGGE